MVMINQIPPAKFRRWLKTNVYIVKHFRLLLQEEQDTKDPAEKNKINEKMRHFQNKVEQMVNTGKTLGLKEDQIKTINLTIVDRIKRGEKPETIIQYFLNGKSRI